MGELEHINVTQHPYLEGSTSIYRRIYLYMSENKISNNGMGCLGLFGPRHQRGCRGVGRRNWRHGLLAMYGSCRGAIGSTHVRPPMDRFFRESLSHGSKDRVNFITSDRDELRRCLQSLQRPTQRVSAAS